EGLPCRSCAISIARILLRESHYPRRRRAGPAASTLRRARRRKRNRLINWNAPRLESLRCRAQWTQQLRQTLETFEVRCLMFDVEKQVFCFTSIAGDVRRFEQAGHNRDTMRASADHLVEIVDQIGRASCRERA